MTAFISGNYYVDQKTCSVIVRTDAERLSSRKYTKSTQEGRAVCYLQASSSFSLDERQATALLFAAAPKMFAALEKAEFEMRYAGWHKPEAICCRQDTYNLVKDALRAAQEAA